jgi:small subunit ribosomal protein S18
MMQRRSTGGGGPKRAGGGGKRRFFYRRAKVNPLLEKTDHIDWKDVKLLQNFIPERGKILPRRISRASARSQRLLKTAIKRARFMALLPYA